MDASGVFGSVGLFVGAIVAAAALYFVVAALKARIARHRQEHVSRDDRDSDGPSHLR